MRALTRRTFGLVALVSVVLAAGTLLIGAASQHTVHEALEVQLDLRIEAETRGLLAAGNTSLAALAATVAERTPAVAASGLEYGVFDAAGQRLAGLVEGPPPEPGRREFLRIRGAADTSRVAQALTTGLADGGRLVVAADRAPVDAADRRIHRLTAASFGATLALGVAGAALLAAIVRRRLHRLDSTARAIIGGDLARRMPRDGSGSEFDRLAATLNEMLDRIGELMDNLRQVSNDVAHDLRTPLARMQQALHVALAGDDDPVRLRAAAETAAARSQELLELFAALLRISEIESLRVRTGFRAVDLSGLATEVADTLRPEFEEAANDLRCTIAADVVVDGDRRLLAQLLVNLLENTLRHTPAGTQVVVALARAPEGFTLRISDDGPGIPAADRDAVLRRFTRLEHSRSKPGHGLGLSLVAAICKAHQFALRLGDGSPGLVVTVAGPVRPG